MLFFLANIIYILFVLFIVLPFEQSEKCDKTENMNLLDWNASSPPGEPVRHRNHPRRVPQLRRRRPVLPDRAGQPAGVLHSRHALPVHVSRRLPARRRRHGRQGVSQDVQNQETLLLRAVELVRGR